MRTIRAGALTLSDRASRGEYEDKAGPAMREALASLPIEWVRVQVIPDDEELIASTLRRWADEDHLDLVLTTGGTGPAPRDRTPEATARVLDLELPGVPEALRAAGREKTPTAALTRGLAGVRGRTVFVNLPGSPRAVREGAEVLLGFLPHLLEKVAGDPTPCGGA
jgi:molybdopterin adenylyltransferase